LNDTKEFTWAIELTLWALDRISDDRLFVTKRERDFYSQFYKYVEQLTNVDFGIFACSFSENSDQLSQWRGYCPGENGISIGFDFNFGLLDYVRKQGYKLIKCEYADDDNIPDCIFHAITETIQKFRDSKLNGSARIENVLLDFQRRILDIAAYIKHYKFYEEAEWRIISSQIPSGDLRIKYRAGKTMRIPYVEIKLSNNKDDYLNIPSVCIGPTPNSCPFIDTVEKDLEVNHIFAYNSQLPSTPFDDENEKSSDKRIYLTPVIIPSPIMQQKRVQKWDEPCPSGQFARKSRPIKCHAAFAEAILLSRRHSTNRDNEISSPGC